MSTFQGYSPYRTAQFNPIARIHITITNTYNIKPIVTVYYKAFLEPYHRIGIVSRNATIPKVNGSILSEMYYHEITTSKKLIYPN